MSLQPLIIAIKKEYVKSRNDFIIEYKHNHCDLNVDKFHNLFKNEIEDQFFASDPFYGHGDCAKEILTIYQNLKCDQVIDMLRFIQESHQAKYDKPYIELCNERNLLNDFMEFRFYVEKDNDDEFDTL